MLNLNKLTKYQNKTKIGNEFNMRLSRAAATSALRTINPQNPNSWEFAGFCQKKRWIG